MAIQKVENPEQLVAKIKEAANNTQKILFSFIVIIVYAIITVYGISDKDLIYQKLPVKLPIFNLDRVQFLEACFALGLVLILKRYLAACCGEVHSLFFFDNAKLSLILIAETPKNKTTILQILIIDIFPHQISIKPIIKLNNAHKIFRNGEDKPFPGGLAKGVGNLSPETP